VLSEFVEAGTGKGNVAAMIDLIMGVSLDFGKLDAWGEPPFVDVHWRSSVLDPTADLALNLPETSGEALR
jgi:hypothetical protein